MFVGRQSAARRGRSLHPAKCLHCGSEGLCGNGVGCPGRIRTSTYGSKGRCPAIRRPGTVRRKYCYRCAHLQSGKITTPCAQVNVSHSARFLRNRLHTGFAKRRGGSGDRGIRPEPKKKHRSSNLRSSYRSTSRSFNLPIIQSPDRPISLSFAPLHLPPLQRQRLNSPSVPRHTHRPE